MKRGLYITFEGIEGCGKTTQLRLTEKRLLNSYGIESIVTREPGGTLYGAAIRKTLLEKRDNEELEALAEIFLYQADRAQHISRVVAPRIKKGKIVLGDRGPDSSVAYQGYARGFDISLIESQNKISLQGFNPNLTLILLGNTEKMLKRASKSEFGIPDRIEQEKLEFHEKVNQGFRKISSKYPNRCKLIEDPNLTRSRKDINDEMFFYIKQLLKL